ncbi:transporter substrate-binding domain-containing protein [Terasakiella sp. SH-1]|uniref:substrate-binding periplasmic protein n=1 Tax=Terasakiella sp. SH-1 TaxID=2560057 RepID=UPI0010741CDC|nr:transporter substrate-binding domain-containing protein [Terasakiella sp. SH-1]
MRVKRYGLRVNALCLSLILMAFLSAATPAKAADKIQAVLFNIPPWGYLDENKEISGIQADVVNAISKEIGTDIDMILTPYKRVFLRLENGASDFGIFFRSAASEKAAEPIAKWHGLEIIVIGRQGITTEQYEDLRKIKIGVRSGGKFHPQFDNDPTIEKVTTKNYRHGITLLMAGKVDAIVGTAATLYYTFKEMNVDLSKLSPPYQLNVKEDWLHFSRSSKKQDAKEKILQAMEKLVSDGTFGKIYNKYLPE